jgi:hypothetical protein
VNSAVLYVGYRRMTYFVSRAKRVSSKSVSKKGTTNVSFSRCKKAIICTSSSGAGSRQEGSNKSYSSGRINSLFTSVSTTSKGNRI